MSLCTQIVSKDGRKFSASLLANRDDTFLMKVIGDDRHKPRFIITTLAGERWEFSDMAVARVKFDELRYE